MTLARRATLSIFALALFGAGCDEGPLDAIAIAPTSLTTGLIAHYTFDETSGAVIDHSGNKRDGTLTDGSFVADGAFGSALHLSGSGYVAVANFPDAPETFTVSAWLRWGGAPLDNGYQTILGTELVFRGGWEINVYEPASAPGVHFGYANPDAKTYVHYECFCISPNQWMHVAAVVDSVANTFTAYINGNLAYAAPAEHAILPGDSTLFIGRWSGSGRFFVGDIDDVTIYGRALAADEVGELFRRPAPDLP